MRKSISIAVLAVVAVAALWTWTSNSGANARYKSPGAVSQIDTLEITTAAKDLLPELPSDAI